MSIKKRILLVDDQSDVVEALSMLLELEGYEVRLACDGATALKVVESFIPDVALIDERMPKMSGRQLAAKLRENPLLAGTRLIALSGSGSTSDVQQAKVAGFDLHVTKPVTLEDVIRAIEDR